jgi:thioredoxin reductase
MNNKTDFDVIIAGGSYAGLAAAMALGRALRKVLIIDNGKPCNIQTPHSHNFLTQDGKTPEEITANAREQVLKYKNVSFLNGLVTGIENGNEYFKVRTDEGKEFTTKKMVFATGIRDKLPGIKGFSECWGISILHCPYCHGFEYKHEKTGIVGNGEIAFEIAKLISNWTKDLTLFTNGRSVLSQEQTEMLNSHRIGIIEKEIAEAIHNDGILESIVFTDGTKQAVKAIYIKPLFEQHSHLPAQLGCLISEDGYIKIDAFHKTSVAGVFACGDNVTRMRTVANAVAMGTTTGMAVNKELIDDQFKIILK